MLKRLAFINFLPIKIIQIGCGGTGSYLTPNVCRLLAHHKSLHPESNISYHLIDADNVEQKNIARQNFISRDITKNKAEVLCTRYSGIFGINMSYSEEYLSDDNISKHINRDCIILGCVDNHATRKIINNYLINNMFNRYNYQWIDSGNELANGQIFINGIYSEKGIRKVTSIAQIYPQIIKSDGSDHPDNRSCADRVTTGEQSINVNIMAANMILNVLDSTLSFQEIPYYQVSFGINNSTNKMFLDDYKKQIDK